MATKIVSTDVAGNVKPCFATSSLVGLTVRVNGEESMKVLDMNGNMVDAQFPPPAAAPTLTSTGSGTGMATHIGKYSAYVYLYAATQRYPLVENDESFGGSLAPRGMPSPAASFQIAGAGEGVHIAMVAADVSRPDLDQVWIFRTAFYATSAEALDDAEAGLLYFVAAVDAAAGSGAVTYDDANPLEGTDQIEMDNFGVPNCRYVVYCDPYWWGWGNFPLSVDGSWVAATGIITLTDGTKWFNGRNGHYVRLEGIETGGIGDNGLWLFKWIDNTHAQLILADGTNATAPSTGAGKIVIQGPPTTLYRSKPRNPFSWGFTEILANGDRIPQVYAFKVGGGLGTAIAQIPTVPYLLLSTEYPAGTFTLDLRLAGSTGFERTLRQISNFYSITSHFSQFTATRQFFPSGSQMRSEKIVLWGWDAKNFCIVETDGIGINVVSEKISKTLRRMTTDRSRQILAHGAYDARNRMNCMWLPSADSFSQVDLLVMHHAPTDQWFLHDEKDLLCTAQFQDGDTNLSKIYGGTETGLMGEMFADGFFSNWISSGRSLGTITEFTTNSITRDDGVEFFLDRDGYVGNWALITDANGENEQWGRISAVDEWTLTFDTIRRVDGTYSTTFSPAITVGSIFYVGVIECRLLKYFDMGAPAEDKKLSEIWATIDGTNISRITGHELSTFLRYYRDRKGTAFAPKVNGRIPIMLHRVALDDDEASQVVFTSEPPSERIKAFGVEIVDRGFGQWRLYNWTLKVN